MCINDNHVGGLNDISTRICTWRKDEELRSEEYDLAFFFSGLMKAGSAESEDGSLEILVFR